MKNKNKTNSLRNTLIGVAALLSLMSALFYTALVFNYTDRSMTQIIDSLLLVEARSFEKNYIKDKNTPLTGSNTIKFYLDSWQGAPSYLKQLPAISQMVVGEIYETEYPEYDDSDTADPDQPEKLISAYCHLLPDGRKLVVISDVDLSILTNNELQAFDEMLQDLLFTSLGFSLFSLFLLLLLFRHLFKQTNILTLWVEDITIEKLTNETPPLYYYEFSMIADKLRNSMQKISEMAIKEQRFLRNVSHELRTPIAVMNANLSLMKRIQLPDNAQVPLTRLSRANKNMQLMTETLLWVNRETPNAPKSQIIIPIRIIEEQLEIHRYLLQEKEVTLNFSVEGEPLPVSMYQAALEIVTGNLIRNALQHTEKGLITIKATNSSLSIENHYQQGYQGEEESFGLGINLVKQICLKLNWDIEVEKSELGFSVKLIFI